MADSETCPICFNRFRDPYMVICCGQSFCKACLTESLAGQNHCPMCRTRQPKYGPNRILAEMLAPEDENDLGIEQMEEARRKDYSSIQRRRNSFRMRAMWARFTSTLGRCIVWLRVQEERIRCLFYMCTLTLLVVYLRIEEEAYQEQEEDPMAKKRIGYGGKAFPEDPRYKVPFGPRRLTLPTTFAQTEETIPFSERVPPQAGYHCGKNCR